MNRKYRKTVIAGNWKMHKTASETRAFLDTLKGALPRMKRCSVVLCVPYVDIPAAAKSLRDSRIAVGAQNLHWAKEGAFTGEVSAAMLAELDVKYVIIGHSERRTLFGQTDLEIRRKLRAALDADLHPILCVGEDSGCRALNMTQERLSCQLKTALAEVRPEEMRRIVLAYEPQWEEDGDVSPDYVGEICAFLRGLLRKLYDARLARSTSILYAGPADEESIAALVALEDVDGGLIDSASLSADRFLAVIRAANQD